MTKTNKGFTLAEVLISLVIIGIIAAITVPLLINGYNKKIWSAQLKKSISTMQNGFKKICADEGVSTLLDSSFYEGLNESSYSDERYKLIDNAMKKAFNVMDSYSETQVKAINPSGSSSNSISSAEKCKQYAGKIFDVFYKQKGSSSSGQCISDTNPKSLFVFTDGSYITIKKAFYSPKDNDSRGRELIAQISIDTNGLKGPNRLGYDAFYFFLTQEGDVIPAGGMSYAITLGGTSGYKSYYWNGGTGYTCKAPGKSYGGYGSGCAAYILENDFEIDF